MTRKKPDSTVIRFIREAWETIENRTHSWERFNHRVRAALLLCAEGFDWEPGDLDRLPEEFRSGPYSTIWRCVDAEELYTEAVRSGNISCCIEYERYCGRKPIIADNVSHGRKYTIVRRKRDRLCIDSRFQWNGEEVCVSSFDDAGRVNACSYQVVSAVEECPKCGHCTASERTKILHRYTISAVDVKADRKKRKERNEP